MKNIIRFVIPTLVPILALFFIFDDISAKDHQPFSPIILHVQPDVQSLKAGQPAAFYVMADGEKPLSYQWKRNGVAIAGATKGTLVIARSNADDTGAYTCEVKNKYGQAITDVLALNVKSDLTETAQLKSNARPVNATAYRSESK